jgi:hypothetical protein
VTCLVGLFIDDMDEVIWKTVIAGATLTSPPEDYNYGYRHAEFRDPFGHMCLIEKKISYQNDSGVPIFAEYLMRQQRVTESESRKKAPLKRRAPISTLIMTI